MPTDWRLIQRFWGLIQPHRRWFWLTVLLLPLATLCQVAGPLIIQYAIDEHVLTGAQRLLALDAILLLGVLLGEYVARAGERFSLIQCGILTLRDLRRHVMAHVASQPVQLFERRPLGAIVSRITSDIEALMDTLSTGVITIISDCVTLFGITVAMWWLSPQLTLATIAVAVPMGILLNIARVRLRHYYDRSRQHTGRMNGVLNEAIAGLRELQLFNYQQPMQQRFGAANAAYFRDQVRIVGFEAGLYSFVEGIGILTIGVMTWYGTQLVLQEQITIGVLVAFITYIQRFYSPIKELSNKIATLQGGLAALGRVFGMLDRDERQPWGHQTLNHVEPSVRFQRVWFAYPQRLHEWRQMEQEPDRTALPLLEEEGKETLSVEMPAPSNGDETAREAPDGNGLYALRDVSLTVRAGERVAIVGWTGSGKSTLIKLLTGMYRPLRGTVEVGDRCVTDYERTEFQRHVGVVHQEVKLFADTAAFNISLGAEDITRERIKTACRIVQADQFIHRLPQAYDTILAAGGRNLSQGQRQLLGFARVLAWSPALVILDEATSSVDSHAEQLIQAAILEVMKRTTTIAIAHRLATVMHADRIIVLHQGRVVEEGTHQTLLAQRGYYHNLYDAQFAGQTA